MVMRIVLEISDDAGEHLHGTVAFPGSNEPAPFYGWLALMRLLETAQSAPQSTGTLAKEEVPDQSGSWRGPE
jgi:hypothetical protein